jgi:ABC-type branched-subunit amino acid transport system substrate-binding protein
LNDVPPGCLWNGDLMIDRTLLVIAATLTVLAGCSSTFTSKVCALDVDCGDGLVCGERDGEAVCLTADEAPLRIGMSAPVSGPSQELGTEMKLGIALAFDAQNRAGGIRGRKLVLDFRDDAYQPANAEKNTRDLLDVQPGQGNAKCPTTTMPLSAGQTPVSATPLVRGPKAVFALIGNVGTPTMVRSAPIAVETGTLFFGAFTGATKLLRDDLAGPCRKYVFNVRASYAQEAHAALEFFLSAKVPDAAHLLSFDQNDAFGDEGYNGLVTAYTSIKGAFTPPTDPITPIPRFRYTRDDETSVPMQVNAAATYLGKLLAKDTDNHTVGIFMTDTYGAAATFITQLRQWQYADDAEQAMRQKGTRLTIYFINVSFVGPNALAARLKEAGTVATPQGAVPYTDNVLVSQVVPNYESDSSDAVKEYRKLIQMAGNSPSFTSLEGYISARIFIAGLLAHKGSFTAEALVPTFEHLPNLSLGVGALSGFSPDNHSYSKSVWGTSLVEGGAFHNRYFWTEGTPLQPFE